MFLLDTHAFLWFIAGDEQLSRRARVLMGDDNTLLFLSAASLWEIAIKVSTSKLILTAPFSEFIPEQLAANYINILPIEVQDLID
jgi:PIN domain nuclease of toxin-antitoxin system